MRCDDGIQSPPLSPVVPQTPTTSASFNVLRSKLGELRRLA